MPQNIYRDKPYYDRFDATKNRTQVLFQGDKALQQSELNELQSIQNHYLGTLGDSIFKDGSIQDDMNFQFLRATADPASAITGIKVRKGKLYLAGKIRTFEEQELKTFTGKGHEEIGVKLTSRIITAAMDPSLLDLTQDVENYLSEGADRLEEKVELTYNDPNATTIYVFDDGQLFTKAVTPDSDLVNKAIATFDSETLGSYQINGFEMYIKEEPANSSRNYITLVVDKGVAHVNGWRVEKPSTTLIQIPKERHTTAITNSTYTTQPNKPITLNSMFVNKINFMSSQYQSPLQAMTRAATGDDDALPNQYTNIKGEGSIVKTNTVTYKHNQDYYFVTRGGISYIHWVVAGEVVDGKTIADPKRPTAGTAYTASFTYDKILADKVDYTQAYKANENGIGGTTTITFIKEQPIANAITRVDFEITLSREDIVALDAKGNVHVHQGEPAEEGQATIPRNLDPLSLKLGNIHIYPDSEKAVVKNTAVTRLRFEDLQLMKARLEHVEANQAVLALERVAQKGQEPLRLRGIFVDPFTDFSRIDKDLTDVAYSFDDAHITIPTETPDDKKIRPTFLENESNAKAWGVNGRIITAPFKETAEIVQNIATSPMNVNPYQVFQANGTISLTPSADNWIDESRVTLYNEEFTTTNINRWWAHQGDGEFGQLNDYNQWLVDNTNLLGGAQWNEASLGWSKTDKAEGEMWSSAQTTRSEMIEYMRQIDVKFRADGFAPLTSDYYIMFDGVRAAVTPDTGHTGGMAGTAKADAQGVIRGTFKIPQNIRTGTREVVITNAKGDPNKPIGDGRAITTFSAQGTAKITTDTITRTHVTFQLYDPLAQSFVFPAARVVSSIGVYFATKDDKLPIIMQIRGLSDGGNPNRTVYAERVLKPTQINVSDTGLVETKIALDDPLMVEAGVNYCVVFITDSANYNMWTATMGETNIADGTVVTSQPYVNGVLFSSSNAVSWSVHQSTDLKFKVYSAEFNLDKDPTIEFDTMRNIDSNGLLLMASYLTPDNTGCKWEVKVLPSNSSGNINNMEWLPLANYASQPTPFLVKEAKLRATFKTNRYISPMLSMDDLLFVNFVSKQKATYTSLNTEQPEAPFDTLTLAYSASLPSNTKVTPYVQLDSALNADGSFKWIQIPDTYLKVEPDNQEFNRFVYTVNLDTQLDGKPESEKKTYKAIRYKLELTAPNRLVRPRVKKLTASVIQRIRA
ncbi:tail protein [Bacillus phage Megatron]|uniref:Tail protein n=3 Tax=Wphvirus megatron TaxID=1987728 RepID=A0A024B3U8_9CAUD|nr:DUF4815 domain-containing protein [Bacillus phage Megatron]YP_009212056.1 tail protein [Bacillus phage Eyuki]YP_009280918.1 DUF4815 domain-containing protein [Bacillus phage SageFayge]AHZ10693.1 tail protein [Bacillus phage Megatron]ALA46773.1 tail protein [Bacillus phage Eyuki]AMW63035.1 tail protein [Bacillus phage SageFayge]